MDEAVCSACGRLLAANAPGGLCAACLFAGAAGCKPSRSGSAAELAVPDLAELNDLLPEFELVELLGRGGMGAVYKALQPELDRAVAIKVLPRDSASDPEFIERFRREARALAALAHPNIVTLYDFGERDGLLYFVMEYVEGVDLAQRIDAHSLTPEEALGIVTQICDALQYSHHRGVVHRDIKPANVLVDHAGRVKIADFGLAKLARSEGPELQLTLTNAAMGTPRYMAPEQMERAAEADHRVDLYAVGVVFYELLTGEPPAGRFLPPSERVDGLGDHFDDLVFRALDADATRRFQSAAELKTSLREAMKLREQVPGGKREMTRRFVLYRALPLAGLAAGASSVGAWFLVTRRGDEDSSRSLGADGKELPALRGLREERILGRVAGDGIVANLTDRTDIVDIALGGGAGREFALALAADGQLVGAGDNRFGQLDLPPQLGSHEPVAIAAACGEKGAHALALLLSGEVIGWGDNSYGQAVVDAQGVVALAAGELHTVALTLDHRVLVSGHGPDGVTEPPSLPPVKAIASGAGFAMALTKDGEVRAWGANRAGQCEVPRWVREREVIAIAAGDSHALALTREGRVYAWGADEAGQLQVPDDLGEVRGLVAGAEGCAALTSNGLRPWGRWHGRHPDASFAVAFGQGSTAWLMDA